MGGGLLQLVAYGAQDAYLTGNPQITFWRGLYKRHTNFAMEPFRVNLTGQAAWGTKHSAILPRHADLVFNTYIELELPGYNSWGGIVNQNFIGFKAIKYVELDIGGQIIDRLYGEWLYIWAGLTHDSYAFSKVQNLTSNDGDTTNETNSCGITGRPAKTNVVYIPLFFYFMRNPGAALPLIALQYHEVKINILWNTAEFLAENAIVPSSTTLPANPKQANLLVDYVYLDVEERRRMAQESHEYLIEQVQFNEDKGISSYNNRIDLTFNHPVKELVWVTQQTGKTQCKYPVWDSIGSGGTPTTTSHSLGTTLFDYDDIIGDCLLQINGQDRMETQNGKYFNTVQPYQHHSGTIGTVLGKSLGCSGIYSYSFALRPEEHQPSGTCNFSRIDTATLVFNVDGNVVVNQGIDRTYDIRVYAINYNILRIMSGMGGLAYSN